MKNTYNFNWKNYLIPPVAIYAFIFLFISALIGGKIDAQSIWVYIVSLIILIVGLYKSTSYVKPESTIQGFKYGVVWLVLLVMMDLILTVPFTGPEFFRNWHPYVSYALTVVVPTLLASQNKFNV